MEIEENGKPKLSREAAALIIAAEEAGITYREGYAFLRALVEQGAAIVWK